MEDPKDEGNPFAWDRIELNVPGSQNYYSSKPWIMKVRKDGKLASGVAQYLGLQDAARKRRDGSQKPGAWAVAVISTLFGRIFKGVTQERWEKTQRLVRYIGKALGLRDEYTKDEEADELMSKMGYFSEKSEDGLERQFLHFKALESAVRFLIYVAMTYTSLIPYLKGIHLTLNSWRPGRDKNGWKTRKQKSDPTEDCGPPPKYVEAVTRLIADVLALMELTSYLNPPEVPVRPTEKQATFLVGDASGTGFGSSTWVQGEEVVKADHGNWSLYVTLNASSNFREAANLVIQLKAMVSNGVLK